MWCVSTPLNHTSNNLLFFPSGNKMLKYLRRIFIVILIASPIGLLFVFNGVNMIKPHVFSVAEKLDLVKPSWASWITSMKPLTDVPHGYKIILFYTAYFGTMPWPQTRGKEKKLTDPYGKKCKVSSCYITYSRQDFSRSNAVVFHSSTMPKFARLDSLLWRKPRAQKWVYYGQENPEKTPFLSKTLNKMFDWSITYRTDSNILDRYGYYVPISRSHDKEVLKNKNFTAGKDRLIAWFASNCVSFRISIVKEISKYIKVDVFGGCKHHFSHQRSEKCIRNSGDCDALAKRYKFYLSLENFNCKDYVTEKYWRNALAHDVVPVLVAGSYNKDILIPGSYIDILDFPNAKSLVNYLKYLDSNSTAYNRYFEWKKNYTFVTTSNWLCDLCELLHRNDSEKEKEPINLMKFWGKENCRADDSYITNVWFTASDVRGSSSLMLCSLSWISYSVLILNEFSPTVE